MFPRASRTWFLLLAFANASAQIKIHKLLTVADGLANAPVSCLYEDRGGYLWGARLMMLGLTIVSIVLIARAYRRGTIRE